MRKLFVLALSFFGLFDSLYLWWVYTSPSHPLVCMGTGCDVARASSYSHLFGQPLPLFGVIMYTALALLVSAESLFGQTLAPAIRWALLVISGLGFLASLALSGIEAFFLHAWCAWCVASAITVTLILLCSIYAVVKPPVPVNEISALRYARAQFAMFVIAILAGAGGFIYLARAGELAAPKAVSRAALAAHLVRPDSHATGDLSSSVTVVEFGDFECPACGLAQKSVETMLGQYGSKIRFVFRQFPMTSMHPQAEKAAEASECAAEQRKFWQADKLFYQNQSDLSIPALKRYAADLHLNTGQFDSCLSSGRMAGRVQRDVADGKALGLNETPVFFVGGYAIYGPPSYAQLSSVVNQELAAASLPASTPEAAGNHESEASAPATLPAKTATHGLGAATPFGGAPLAQLGAASPLACSPDEAKLEQPSLIRTPEAKKLFQQNPKALFVDVRAADDFARDHIPAAVNIPVEEISAKWTSLPKDRVIVFYEEGNRSGSPEDVCAFSRAAGRVVLAHGFDKARVKVYQDGLKGWQAAGLPVVK
ncbi:MAG: thioredoxin domain-containing protein [Terriglobia bacterium]